MKYGLRAAALALTISIAPLPIARAAAAERAASYTFAFQEAPIAQVADEILGNALGLTFTVDPAVTGSMSFRIDRRLTRPQLLQAFEAALDANGVAMVRDGETLLLTPRDKAKGSTGVRMADQGRSRGGYEVVAVPLSYAAPSEVAKALEAIGPEKSVVYYNDKQGLLLLGGSGAQLQSALETVKVFDQNGLQGAKIRWFPLSNASASTLAGELDRILQASGGYGATIVPMKRLNGVFVFGRTTQILDDVSGWVSQLDVPSQDEAQSLWTYRPKNISAESLGRTLNSVLSGQSNVGVSSVSTDGQAGAVQSPAQTAQSASFVGSDDDPVRVGVDPESNTLLVSASLARWKQIERILAEIDRRPSQILIEASILEVTLSDEFRLGVDWSVLANSGKLKITSSADRQGVVGPPSPASP